MSRSHLRGGFGPAVTVRSSLEKCERWLVAAHKVRNLGGCRFAYNWRQAQAEMAGLRHRFNKHHMARTYYTSSQRHMLRKRPGCSGSAVRKLGGCRFASNWTQAQAEMAGLRHRFTKQHRARISYTSLQRHMFREWPGGYSDCSGPAVTAFSSLASEERSQWLANFPCKKGVLVAAHKVQKLEDKFPVFPFSFRFLVTCDVSTPVHEYRYQKGSESRRTKLPIEKDKEARDRDVMTIRPSC
eukprot:scaffold22742_cov139-Cylindrotheca_fusiformis.AAC.5